MSGMLKCPNCGAPIEGHKCQYCGTIIFDFATIEVGKPVWISIKTPGGQVMLAHVMLESMNVHVEPAECSSLYADNEVFTAFVRKAPPRLTMEFVEIENKDKIMHFISERLSASITDVGDLDID